MKQLVPLLSTLSLCTLLATAWCLSAIDTTYAKYSKAAQSLAPAQWKLFSYGQEFPSGLDAVNWIYGPDGTWQNLTNVQYKWNYYQQYTTATHPYDKTALIQYANGKNQTTARDADGHLLLDSSHSGEIDIHSGGAAFEEHSGRGIGNQVKQNPFSNFWFDDNWLARYMSIAYNRHQPNGLSQYNDFTRWAILGGDSSHWQLYNNNKYVDQLALDGLNYIATNQFDKAYKNWNQIDSTLSGDTYDPVNERHIFPKISDTYNLGLFKILTDKLILAVDPGSGNNVPDNVASNKDMLTEYSIDLASDILSDQVQAPSCPEQRCSWVSGLANGQPDPNTLMNTEATTVEVLALGAGGLYTYEAGRPPLSYTTKNNYLVRPYHVLSAVTGQSRIGYMSNGPYQQYPTGSYNVDFYLRVPNSQGMTAYLDIYDASSRQILAKKNVQASDLQPNNRWTRISLPINVSNAANSLGFRVWWNGQANMDLASITMRPNLH